MDDIERVITGLVRSIETRFPQLLDAPFRIHEIHERFIPYRTYRTALGVDTSEYYELAITRLLSGEGGYISAPDEVRNALISELESPNPDSRRFREFDTMDVQLTSFALNLRGAASAAKVKPNVSTTSATEPSLGAVEVNAPRPSANVVAPQPAPSAQVASAPTQPARKRKTPPGSKSARNGKQINAPIKEWVMPPGQRTTSASELGGKCRYCRGVLPDGIELTYCPHCGQDLTVHHCPACSTELQVGWKFCVTCGRSVEE